MSKSVKNPRPPAPGTKSTIRIAGPIAEVEHAPVPLIQGLLIGRRRAYEVGGPRGITATTIRSHAGRIMDGGLVAFMAGLVPRVVAALERHGHEVEVLDTTPPRPRVVIDEAVLGKLAGEEARFARLVAEGRAVHVYSASHHRRVALIAAVARAIPRARIVVTTASCSQARAIRPRLMARLHEHVGLYCKDGRVLSPTRIRVSTVTSLEECSSDIVIFFEAGDVVTSRYADPINQLLDRHIVGFSAPDLRLGEWERLWLEGVLGPVTRVADDPMGGRAEVCVAIAESPPVVVPTGPGDLDRKRQLVWHNGRRNRVVAEVAIALAAGRQEALWRHGLALDETARWPIDAGIDPRVAVLVESPEHGRALAKRLPGWPLLEAASGRDAGPGRDDPEPDLPPRSIITLVRALRTRSLDVDALIRADGSDWPLDLPGFPTPSPAGVARTVLLVDLGDDGDEVAVGATRRRLGDYRARGWAVDVPARWDRES